METSYYYLALMLFIFLITTSLFLKRPNLPPGPLALPIIGHLYLIRKPLHLALESLSSKYGPVLCLQFGSRRVLVVSSPSAAAECFTKNDIVFANRPRTLASDIFTFNYHSFVWTPYGHLWRNLRRLSVIEIFSATALQKASAVREAEVSKFVYKLFKVSEKGTQKVDLKFMFSLLAINVMLRLVSGKPAVEDDAGDMAERNFFQEFKKVFFPSLLMNKCDFFPILRLMGYKGIEKSMIKVQREREKYLQKLIDGVRSKKFTSADSADNTNKVNKCLIEKLLELQGEDPEFCTDDVIKSQTLMMFIAGTETTATTLEWAMSLLLNHPEALQRAKAEIDSEVGHEHLISDVDLAKLPYLRCVVNETLRLYPAAPLLLPHCTSEDCTVGGYEIPRGTILMANVWAIHRNPSVWEEPSKFKPERFEFSLGEQEGYKHLPFGIGRRACPGAPLALRMTLLVLGAAIQCFDWERTGPEMMDMDYTTGLTISKTIPLEAFCRPRQEFINLLSQLKC